MTRKHLGVRIFIGVISLLVTAAAVTGLVISGSPSLERARRLDERRVSDLQQMSYAMDQFWNIEKRIPNSIDELRSQRDVYLQGVADPETGEPYEFNIKGDKSFELCANFLTSSTASEPKSPEPYYSRNGGNDFWSHPAGRQCYTLEVRIFEKP